MSSSPPVFADDPYAERPTLWQRHPQLGWLLLVAGLTVVLTSIAFPPVNIGEAAYAFAIPAVLWAYRAPAFRLYAGTMLASSVVAWTLLLGWLHHVSWLGLFLLGPFIGLVNGLWYLGVWWAMPRLLGHRAMIRIIGLLGLAALWVMNEWLRSIVFTGFPWLPLAASQWEKPLVLQSAAYGGAWLVSFVLVLFNLGAAAYAHRIFFEGATGLRKRSPEFMTALMVLVCGSFPMVGEMMGRRPHELMRVALAQPAIPQGEKWDPARAQEVLQTLERVTLAANDRGVPQAILWPEAVTPWALYGDPNVRPWLESIARRTGKPLLLGTIYTEGPEGPGQRWYNGAFVVDPVRGLQEPGYAKRHLVPFGEYVPLRSVFGWLEKVVPIGGDFQTGSSAAPLTLSAGRNPVPVGVLICFEDIFPALARAEALEGAEVLAVLTNNGWFGQGGAAYQHAAHSVLRAVETRRPVVRVGNAGWSGWIDEFGHIRAVLRDENGSIYFRGAQEVTVTRDLRWLGRNSFYTEHGDWFLLVCAILATASYYLVLTLRPPAPKPAGETEF